MFINGAIASPESCIKNSFANFIKTSGRFLKNSKSNKDFELGNLNSAKNSEFKNYKLELDLKSGTPISGPVNTTTHLK